MRIVTLLNDLKFFPQCMVFVESPDPGAWQDSPCQTKGVTPKVRKRGCHLLFHSAIPFIYRVNH